MAMLQPLSNALLLAAAALLAGANSAVAAGLERVAQQGLVPPTVRAAEASEAAGEWRQPGLRMPRNVTAGIGTVLDWTSPAERGPVIYSGLRPAPALGFGASQTVTGLYYPLASGWFSTIESSVDAPSALATRGYGMVGQVHRLLPGGWGVSLGLRHNVYDVGVARPFAGAAEGSTALAGPVPGAHPAGTSTFASTGYELRLNYRYGERNVLGLAYGVGSDFDYTRQVLGLYPNDGRQFGLTGEHWLTPEWSLSYGLMAQEQIGPHRGQGLRLGLRYRF